MATLNDWYIKSLEDGEDLAEKAFNRMSISRDMLLKVRKGKCLIWTGEVNKQGHPLIRYRAKTISVARIYYYSYYHYLPSTNLVRICNNRSCVNPLHMDAGRHSIMYSGNFADAINSTDLRKKGRKITNEQVIRLRELSSTGNYTSKQLKNCMDLDISETHLRNILRGKHFYFN